MSKAETIQDNTQQNNNDQQENKSQDQNNQTSQHINHHNQQQDNHRDEVTTEQAKVDEDDFDEDIQKFEVSNPQKAKEHKIIGNQFFQLHKYKQAIEQYQKGLRYSDEKNLRATLYSNIAISYIKEDDYQPVKRYCKKALKQDPNHRKSRTNLARYYQHESKIQEAYQQYRTLDKNIEGSTQAESQFVKKKLVELQPKMDAINQKRKKEVMDGLKTIGNSILGYFGMSLDNFKFEKGANGGYNISMNK